MLQFNFFLLLVMRDSDETEIENRLKNWVHLPDSEKQHQTFAKVCSNKRKKSESKQNFEVDRKKAIKRREEKLLDRIT